jgi:hypothetical protein
VNRFIVMLACAMVLAGATGCGSGLKSKNVRTLQLGQTTEAQVRKMFGKPDMQEDRSDATGTGRIFRYDHVGGAVIALYRVADVRYLAVEVHNGRVRGWLFGSTAPGDSTKIREAAVPQVVKGQSRDDVARLLGEPAGRALKGCLIVDYKDEFGPAVEEIWAWFGIKGASGAFWSQVKGRLYMVKFDGQGRVVETLNRAMRM